MEVLSFSDGSHKATTAATVSHKEYPTREQNKHALIMTSLSAAIFISMYKPNHGSCKSFGKYFDFFC